MTKTELKENIDNNFNDEEVLEYFSLFLDRVNVGNTFVQNEDGAITHSVMAFQCGDKIIVSDPSEFDWPLMVMPKPKAMETNNDDS